MFNARRIIVLKCIKRALRDALAGRDTSRGRDVGTVLHAGAAQPHPSGKALPPLTIGKPGSKSGNSAIESRVNQTALLLDSAASPAVTSAAMVRSGP